MSHRYSTDLTGPQIWRWKRASDENHTIMAIVLPVAFLGCLRVATAGVGPLRCAAGSDLVCQ